MLIIKLLIQVIEKNQHLLIKNNLYGHTYNLLNLFKYK